MIDVHSHSPKYHQLKEHILDRIRRGELAPGQQLNTEYFLAREFKLSRHTVRQALGELEQEGWIIREQGRGTFVADQNTQKSKSVALIFKSITNFIFPEIIHGIESTLGAAGYELRLCLSYDDPKREAEHLKRALNSDVEGIILEPARNTMPCGHLPYLQALEEQRIPVLLLHSFWPELNSAYIVLDDYMGGYLATQYLLQLGHRRIAGIFNDTRQGLDRKEGFIKALQEYGVEPIPGFIGQYQFRYDFSLFSIQFTEELLQRPDPPTAIFCYNDLSAIRALEAIRRSGRKVPDDISLIGFNDSSLTTMPEVKLTSVKHPKKDMGRDAASLMMSMIKRRIEKPQTIIQPELIVRGSCRRLLP